MDGLSLQRRVHDENAGVVGGTALNNKPAGLGQAGGSSLKPGPLSARKAFGNITNKAQDSGADGDGGATVKRRAFGELSANRPASQQAGPEPGKPSALGGRPSGRQPFGCAPALQQQQATPAAANHVQQQQPLDLAQRYAAGGVERFAGKTWQQMEDEREAAEEAAAAAAARRLTARLSSWRVGAAPLAVSGGLSRLAAAIAGELAPSRMDPRHQPIGPVWVHWCRMKHAARVPGPAGIRGLRPAAALRPPAPCP
jgi:hypothetical protein